MDELIKNYEKKFFWRKITDFWSKFIIYIKTHKKLSIIIGAIIIILVAVGLGLFFTLRDKPEAPKPEAEKTATPEAVAVGYPAILDGISTDQSSSLRHPLAIIVENHPDARPQAGLDKASIIYEAIAEGGITRFLALFGTYQAEKVGPVRSARTYYVDWALGYNAYLGHVGGNIDALDKIKADKVYDLDQFAYSAPYWREGSGVASEHTAFTSTSKLWDKATELGYPTANNFNVYKFKEEPEGADRLALPEKQKITIDFSNTSYKVVFEYDKVTNSYKRYLAGTAHVDRVTKNQLSPKNVIVMTVKRKSTVTKINESGYDMTNIGTGAAHIFIDGKETIGTWKKNSKTERELFYDASGAEVVFDRGQTWISVLNGETGQSLTVE
ncbi:MAG: DUF3048 domain-containing protein [Patescibacteria group bacterium]